MSILNALGLKFGTDKSTLLHGYLSKYETFFPEPSKVKAMLEIGLQRGGKWRNAFTMPSLQMWGEFFPNAKLFGFDLKKLKSPDKRITFIQGDQSKAANLLKLRLAIKGELDFIIDDGSHVAADQLHTFLILFDKLRSGGIYIIEDCNAVVQKSLPLEERIETLIMPFIEGRFAYEWVSSDSAGEKSSLIIIC